MALDPSIPLQLRPMQLDSPLASANSLLGILGTLQQNKLREAQMQQAAQKMQQEQQMRGALANLPQDVDQNTLLRTIAPFASPDALLRTHQSSLDRGAAREQRLFEINQRGQQRIDEINRAAAERRISQQEASEQRRQLAVEMQAARAQSSQDLARLAAGLRQPPQPTPPITVPDPTSPTGFKFVSREQALGQPAPAPASAREKPLTEFQGKAILYGTRATQSDKILKTLEDKISLPGLEAGRAMGRIGNYALSSAQQRVDQAQRDFVNAVLRQESGAVISDPEFANAQKQYFPQPGDDPATIVQKRRNREIAIQGFSRMAGPGAADIEAIRNAPLLPGGPSGATSGWTPDKEQRYQELLRKQNATQ